MMTYLRKAADRGHANFGWLDSHHTFSFGSYYDPEHMGYGALRVINDDTVAPSGGFDTHGHRDMEIVTYVIDGALEHKDSMGNAGLITAGEVQRMSAGTGVTHSEFNGSAEKPVHFLQIWIVPQQQGTAPAYEQTKVPQVSQLTPLVTPNGDGGSVSIGQQVSISRLKLAASESFQLAPTTRGYLHVVSGEASVGDIALQTGDGLGSLSGDTLEVVSHSELEALWFELPA